MFSTCKRVIVYGKHINTANNFRLTFVSIRSDIFSLCAECSNVAACPFFFSFFFFFLVSFGIQLRFARVFYSSLSPMYIVLAPFRAQFTGTSIFRLFCQHTKLQIMVTIINCFMIELRFSLSMRISVQIPCYRHRRRRRCSCEVFFFFI